MYHETYDSPRFQVGDNVRVVDEPYENCPFCWIDEMTLFCGKEVQIEHRTWIERDNIYAYWIKGSSCSWCANCFDETANTIPEQTEAGFLEDFRNLIS